MWRMMPGAVGSGMVSNLPLRGSNRMTVEASEPVTQITPLRESTSESYSPIVPPPSLWRVNRLVRGSKAVRWPVFHSGIQIVPSSPSAIRRGAELGSGIGKTCDLPVFGSSRNKVFAASWLPHNMSWRSICRP